MTFPLATLRLLRNEILRKYRIIIRNKYSLINSHSIISIHSQVLLYFILL